MSEQEKEQQRINDLLHADGKVGVEQKTRRKHFNSSRYCNYEGPHNNNKKVR